MNLNIPAELADAAARAFVREESELERRTARGYLSPREIERLRVAQRNGVKTSRALGRY